MPIGAMATAGLQVFALVRRLREELGVNTTCGASNISFGLPNRHGINAAFLPMAIASGMTSAIMNPTRPQEMDAIRAANLLDQQRPLGRRLDPRQQGRRSPRARSRPAPAAAARAGAAARMTAALPWRETADGVELAVRLTPRGGAARIEGIADARRPALPAGPRRRPRRSTAPPTTRSSPSSPRPSTSRAPPSRSLAGDRARAEAPAPARPGPRPPRLDRRLGSRQSQ